MDYSNLTALELIAGFRTGDLSVEACAAALLDRVERHVDLNAFIRADRDHVLEAACAADARRASGAELGLLHGLPVVLKDNIDTADYPTTGGTPALADHRPKRNAPIVQAMIDAGAFVFGKTNLHELAFGVTSNNAACGPVRNPYDLTRIAGGSSGGTSAAVAARLAPAGLGTDTGGSVRIPSSLCGTVGLRPTMGRYSQDGIIPISNTRDTAGPIARSVGDIALLDGVITGRAGEITPAKLKGLRLGVPREYFYENVDAGTLSVVEAALDRLRDYGVELVEADIHDVGPVHMAADQTVVMYEAIPQLERYLRGHASPLDAADVAAKVASPDVKSILDNLIADGGTPEDIYRKAIDVHRPKLQAMYRGFFAQTDVAAVVFPTTPMPAAKIGEDDTVLLNGEPVPTFNTFFRNTSPISIAGVPGLTIPAGLTADGMPVGLEFDGPEGSDRQLLAIGLAVEANEPVFPAPKL